MKKLIFASVGIFALVACGVGSHTTNDDARRLNDQANGGATSSSASPTTKKNITSGDWEVGKKENLSGGIITPGTYVVTTPSDGYNCYWATVKSFDNVDDPRSIIANGNIDPGTTARVVIKSSYAGLHLSGECLATRKK